MLSNIGLPGLGLMTGFSPEMLIGLTAAKILPVPMPDPQFLLIISMITA
ncbi:hypothetical protein [Antarctobacter sp.]|nr:hypothetical protein [Antarctobacter sp.]